MLRNALFALSLTLLPRAAAWAFVPAHHGALTESALQSLEACLPAERRGTFVDAGAVTPSGRLVIEASVREDDKSAERWENWHFYDRFRATRTTELRHWMTRRHATLHPLYERVSGELEEAAAAGDAARAFRLLGRLIHYLQDMAVPAHVAPVFHPRWLVAGDDEVDSYPLSPTLALGCAAAEESAADGRPAGDFYPALLERGAQDTLRPLFDSAADPHPAPWTCYWTLSQLGWGSYGTPFGEERFSCGGASYRLTKGDYDAFARRRHEQAVRDTAAAAAYLLKRLNAGSSAP